MSRQFILVPPARLRELTAFAFAMALAGAMMAMLSGCSPKMDWREVRHEDAGWKAIFPGKPVEVTRRVQLPDSDMTVSLTMKSAKIDQTMFAVGWATSSDANVRRQLEAAILANIQARPETIRRKSVQIQGHAAVEVSALGMMRTDMRTDGAHAAASPTPLSLWMRSVVINSSTSKNGKNDTPGNRKPALRVIEIIALGPQAELTEDDARQFIDSLQLGLNQ